MTVVPKTAALVTVGTISAGPEPSSRRALAEHSFRHLQIRQDFLQRRRREQEPSCFADCALQYGRHPTNYFGEVLHRPRQPDAVVPGLMAGRSGLCVCAWCEPAGQIPYRSGGVWPRGCDPMQVRFIGPAKASRNAQTVRDKAFDRSTGCAMRTVARAPPSCVWKCKKRSEDAAVFRTENAERRRRK
jgi:hypothetical protein